MTRGALSIEYEELSMLTVRSEIDFFSGPFQRRAAVMCSKQNLPEWKIPAIARNLELKFLRFLTDGISAKDALSSIE